MEGKCRYCGKNLSDRYAETQNMPQENFYGGKVCCRRCDIEACLRLSSSIAKSLNSPEYDQVKRNWGI